MECNKEDAIKAKEMAEQKMQSGDFEAAWKFVLKAKRLYPGLDNISQLLTVCEVHCSAEKTVNGTENDWYGILQIERNSDEIVIKKQYRKLALLLHPDKNKFAGAESAFKLIGEANRVLSDPLKRSVYDAKYRSLARPAAAPPKRAPCSNLNKNSHTAKNAPTQQNTSSQSSQKQQFGHTFWTSCSSCKTWYQYYRAVQNRTLCCQTCQKNFVALDLGINGVPPVATQSHSQFVNKAGVPNQGQSTVDLECKAAEPPSAFSHLTQKTGVDSNISRSYKSEEPKARSAAVVGESSELEKKVNGLVDVGTKKGDSLPKDSGKLNAASRKRERQSVDTSLNKSFDIGGNDRVVPDTTNVKESEMSNTGGRKTERKPPDESSDNFKTGSNDPIVHVKADVCKPKVSATSTAANRKRERKSVDESRKGGLVQENGGKKSAESSDPLRRSSRQKQNVGYKMDLSGGSSKDGSDYDDDDDNDFVSPPKKSKGSKSSGATVDVKEASDGVRFSKEKSSATDEMLSSNKSKTRDENVVEAKPQVEESTVHSDESPKSQSFEYPEAEFNNFDEHKAEGCFANDQVWAVYDPADGMPRFYARVIKVYTSPEFKLQIRWLEASPDDKDKKNWCDEELPAACGKFKNGEKQEIDDCQIFSHQISCSERNNKGKYFVYPRKGETWAIFKDWNMNWSSEPEKHRPPYHYEFVEIISDYAEPIGIRVLFFQKVEGFVSVFRQADLDGVISFSIPSSEFYQFSHRVPSFKLTGNEAVGIPSGSYELDPASLPSYCFSDIDLNVRQKMEDGAPTDISSKTTKVELSIESEKSCTSSRHEGASGRENSMLRRSPRVMRETCKNNDKKNNVNQCKEARVDDSCQNDGRTEIPKKHHKSELQEVAPHLPRRSPRDISKRNSQTNAGATSNQPDDTDNLPAGSGNSRAFTKPAVSSGLRVIHVDYHNFDIDKSVDKFQVGQIWATYSKHDGLPTNYVEVKKIESTPNFILHVIILEPQSSGKNLKSSPSCGVFKIKSHKATALPVTRFSNQLKAEPAGKNMFGIYPRTGEVWALHKNWNPDMECLGSNEFDIVEVQEDNEQGVTVVVLMPFKGSKTFYRVPVSLRAKTYVMEIPRSEFGRFSHRCSAFMHTGEIERRTRRFWELEQRSVLDKCIVLD